MSPDLTQIIQSWLQNSLFLGGHQKTERRRRQLLCLSLNSFFSATEYYDGFHLIVWLQIHCHFVHCFNPKLVLVQVSLVTLRFFFFKVIKLDKLRRMTVHCAADDNSQFTKADVSAGAELTVILISCSTDFKWRPKKQRIWPNS